jgi:hypothetical protein
VRNFPGARGGVSALRRPTAEAVTLHAVVRWRQGGHAFGPRQTGTGCRNREPRGSGSRRRPTSYSRRIRVSGGTWGPISDARTTLEQAPRRLLPIEERTDEHAERAPDDHANRGAPNRSASARRARIKMTGGVAGQASCNGTEDRAHDQANPPAVVLPGCNCVQVQGDGRAVEWRGREECWLLRGEDGQEALA